MKDRILRVRKESGYTQDAFAEKLKLSKNFVWMLEKGERVPSERTITDICRKFKVRYQWLTEGVEPMYEELDSECMTRIDAIMTGENEFAKNLFKAFSKLDTDEWKMLEKIIQSLKGDKGV